MTLVEMVAVLSAAEQSVGDNMALAVRVGRKPGDRLRAVPEAWLVELRGALQEVTRELVEECKRRSGETTKESSDGV